MNSDQYIQRVRDLFGEFGHLDVDRACSYFHDDGYIQMMMKEPYAGMAEIRNMFTLWATRYGAVDTPIRQITGTGNVVMVEWSDESTHNGQRYVVPCVGVVEFDGDRIKAWRLYYDSALEASSETTGLKQRAEGVATGSS